MNKVIDSIGNKNGRPVPQSTELSERQEYWVTALFVQFRLSRAENPSESKRTTTQIHGLLTTSISAHHGDIVALAGDAALALFSGKAKRQSYVHDGVAAAEAIMSGFAEINGERLAQDLAPMRVAIGLDAGSLGTATCPRHPALDTGLEPFFKRARRLSDLNYQTPFPAIFASRAVVDNLDYAGPHAIQNLGDVFVDDQAAPMVVYAILNR